MTETVPVHPVVRDFMARRGIADSSVRSDGRIAVTVDGKYRVYLRPASDGRLALQAKVMDLPDADADGRAADAAIDRLLQLSAGMVREHASTLCLEAPGQRIQLQQLLAADSRVEQLEAEIAEFTNALEFWVRIGKSL